METDAGITRVRSPRLRMVLLAIALGSMFFVHGCGSDATSAGSSAKEYPAGVSEDVEKQLKYDARVESFEPDGEDGENLVVNVNDSWASSPQGMQERAVGQWYSLWHAQHSGGKVIVKHNGNPVASWSAKGYKPEKLTTGEGEVHSES
ncbi:MAG TPA: hypothetical protein VK747_18240 [Blastocatellia bacterium]|nr:hypothetical protein [Blastocatellia bacterium]